jgi:mannitol-1-phosphate 5-dehydrogenase
MMKKYLSVLIIGAGAIGRGYAPWLFEDFDHKITFADANEELVEKLLKVKSFSSFMTKFEGYKELVVSNFDVRHIYEIEDTLESFDLIITAVGPRNFLSLSQLLQQTSAPIWCFENDRSLVDKMKSLIGRDNVYFGVPDVIASNEHSAHGLDIKNGLGLITEDGPTFIETHPYHIGSHVKHVSEDEIRKQWAAKLYIHNTPHCVAAYLGSLANVNYIHEALQIPEVEILVTSVASEMSQMVQRTFNIEEEFCEFYLKKEIKRFKNKLLFDPISRVAREPLRKLELNGRLLGAASLAIEAQIMPTSTLIGIHAAMHYDNESDPDYQMQVLLQSLDPKEFLSKVLGLDPQNILFELLVKRWPEHDIISERLRAKVENRDTRSNARFKVS